MAKCIAVTVSGRKCTREAKPHSKYCWQHSGGKGPKRRRPKTTPRRRRSPIRRRSPVRRQSPIRGCSSIRTSTDEYFRNPEDMTTMHKKYCKCIVDVAGNQSDSCLRRKSWGSGRCYNPYAICTRSTGRRGALRCYANYKPSNIPADRWRKYQIMEGKVK